MKKTCLFIGIFISLLSCNKTPIVLEPENHLKKFSKTKSQLFDIDTLSYFRIMGKYGTEIFFLREDFNVKDEEKITAELIEIYDFKELLLNNINTITSNDELLESSGVIYIDFKSDAKSIELKENTKLLIRFPEDKLLGNELYTAKPSGFDQFKWVEEKQVDTLFSINRGGGLFQELIISKDSVDYYKSFNLRTSGFETFDELWNSEVILSDSLYVDYNVSFGIFKNLGWINIDKIVRPDDTLSFNLIESENIENLTIYIVYEGLNSFLSMYRTSDNLSFRDIPVKGKTELIILGNKNDKIYADKILLNEIEHNSGIKINLKVKSQEEIIQLIE